MVRTWEGTKFVLKSSRATVWLIGMADLLAKYLTRREILLFFPAGVRFFIIIF